MAASVSDLDVFANALIILSVAGNLYLAYALALRTKAVKQLMQERDEARDVVRKDRETAMDTGQTLACLCVQLNVAGKLRAKDPGQATLALERARELAGDSLARVRELVSRSY